MKVAAIRAAFAAVFLVVASGSAFALCEEHKFASDEWWQCISSQNGAGGG